MSGTGYNVGDTVRVSYEGVVHQAGPARVELELPDGSRASYFGGNMKVEVIRSAYVDGGVYLDDGNDILKYTATGFEGGPGWFLFSNLDRDWSGTAYPVTWATNPIKRLDGPISERQGNG